MYINKHQFYTYIFIWLIPKSCPRSFPQTGDTIIKLFEDESQSCSVVSDSSWPHGLYSPWNSLGQNTGVGSLSFLQGIFPTQGSNPGLLHCRQILYQLSHQESPRILELAASPFSRGSSRSRNWNGVSYTAGGFFASWATRDIFLIRTRQSHSSS